MIYKTLIVLAAAFGLFQFFRIKDLFARVIIAWQVIAIGVSFISKEAFTIGYSLFVASLIPVLVYGLIKSGFTSIKRLVIIVPTLFALLAHAFQLLHFPGAKVLGFTLVLPIAAFVYLASTNIKNYKNEIGFLAIIAVDSAIHLALLVQGF